MESKKAIGKKFPKIAAYSLAKTEVILPDMVNGKVTLIAIAFVREAQEIIDSWSIPFENKFSNIEGYSYFEVPMLDGLWKFFRGSIDGGMRSGIPLEKHKNVVTYYGNYKNYTNYLFIEDIKNGYVFLLDKEGIIRFIGMGLASDKDVEKMIEIAKNLGE